MLNKVHLWLVSLSLVLHRQCHILHGIKEVGTPSLYGRCQSKINIVRDIDIKTKCFLHHILLMFEKDLNKITLSETSFIFHLKHELSNNSLCSI